jgi:hypothetical protein
LSTDIACSVSWNGALDVSHPDFLIPSYNCLANTRRIIGAQAKVLFDAVSAIVGSDTGMGKTHTRIFALVCIVDFRQLESSARFFCNYNSVNTSVSESAPTDESPEQ